MRQCLASDINGTKLIRFHYSLSFRLAINWQYPSGLRSVPFIYPSSGLHKKIQLLSRFTRASIRWMAFIFSVTLLKIQSQLGNLGTWQVLAQYQVLHSSIVIFGIRLLKVPWSALCLQKDVKVSEQSCSLIHSIHAGSGMDNLSCPSCKYLQLGLWIFVPQIPWDQSFLLTLLSYLEF